MYDREIEGESSTSLVGPDQNQLEVRWCFKTKVHQGNQGSIETIYVVDGLHLALVERPTIKSLHFLANIAQVKKSKQKTVSRFLKLFTGLGCIRRINQVKLEENALPYSISAPRRVPITLLSMVKQQGTTENGKTRCNLKSK